jgi:hypothetical protein
VNRKGLFRKKEVKTPFQMKQELAYPSRYYGDGGTIHSTGQIDVEVHNGRVVSVWFRCQELPFRQVEVSTERANTCLHGRYDLPLITGVEVLDRSTSQT